MAYLRAKVVKGEKYLYLVRSVWDPNRSTARQETIKYLGKASQVSKDDIPLEYRNDPKIISFLASGEALDVKRREEMLSKIREKLLSHFVMGELEEAKKLYEGYRAHAGTTSFFEKILTPVMYEIGNLWEKNRISIADEHISSNTANSLVKAILNKNSIKPSAKKKVVICTPDGEYHSLGAAILEACLSCSGFKVYNLSPSQPHESITTFVETEKPDAVLVSITLEDSIRPGQRLVKKLAERTTVPIVVGGQAVKKTDAKFEAKMVQDMGLKELSRLLRSERLLD